MNGECRFCAAFPAIGATGAHRAITFSSLSTQTDGRFVVKQIPP
jgi:hypothetical protein